MSKELTKNLHCVVLIGGIEIWLEEERVEKLKELMETQKHIELEGSIIAVSQITGIFVPSHMDEQKRLKQGQWRCMKGNNWHDRGEKCHCSSEAVCAILKKLKEAQRKCKKDCQNGYVSCETSTGIMLVPCSCSKKLFGDLKKAKRL